jgi:hypothetical protein
VRGVHQHAQGARAIPKVQSAFNANRSTTIGQIEPAPTSLSLISLHAAEHGFAQDENLAHEYTASPDLIYSLKLTNHLGDPRALFLHR